MFAGPVALMAPGYAAPFFARAMRGVRATLHLTGTSGRPPAFNFVGRIDRGKRRWLAVSTPRSGRPEDHTAELQSLKRSSYAVLCLKKNTVHSSTTHTITPKLFIHP